MIPTIRRFWKDDRGAEMIEWAVVTIILLGATVGVLIALRDLLNDVFKSIFARLQEDPDDAWTTDGAAPASTPSTP